MKILVMGSGGVGGYFGAKLARAGESVTFVARGAHLDAIRAKGLRVKSTTEGEFVVASPATDDPARAGVADLVLFCVKSYDTGAAARAVRPAVGPDTAILCLQNGVDNEDKIGEIVGPGHVVGGAAYVLATIESPGVIAHAAGGRIAFGEMDGSQTARAGQILEAFQRAGIPTELTPRIVQMLWEKYLFIAAHSGMTAVTRCPIGVIRSIPETRRMYRLILEELAAVAKAAGVELPPETVDGLMGVADGVRPYKETFFPLPPHMTSSLYHDLTHSRPLELEALQGHALRLGEKLGVPTPVLFSVYAALRPYRDGAPA
ncbi:MAG: 2-dehydropantoate 2-reductase [Candidatus Rokubacteria bacterium]|nr:2-dehydropantoate 2-reductase [Candidatus Rokubacteria bacterium]